MKSFKHSGQSGDIIYSLPAIASFNEKSNLYLQLNVKANLYEGAKNPLGNVFLNDNMFNFIAPLIEKQDYIEKIDIYKNQKIDIDLDQFRTVPINPAMGALTKRYFYFVNNFYDLSSPWLKVYESEESLKDKILVCRSERYRNEKLNYSYLQIYKNVVFCGIDDEWADFKRRVPNAERIIAKDAYQLAVYINSCKFFIGNQSFPFSIAEGLKKERLLETCTFAPNVIPMGGKCNEFVNQKSLENYVREYNK